MESGKWLYHIPNFESDNYNLEMMKYAPWSGHREFAYDYVCNMKPNVIVELGSHYGCSAFTFLQAIKDYNLQTKFYAIDTWAGDKYTENDYVENIYEEYKRVQTVCFAHQNKEMMRMTFDEAVVFFEDNSIDLLHIDGSHIYDDVKHDFEIWKDKVKKDGVIFLHDIAEDIVLGEKMGSHFFWNELKREYPFFVEFQYSYGLGIIFFDKQKWEMFNANVILEYYSKNEIYAVNEYKDKIRKNFFEIRERDKHIEFLYEQIDILKKHLKDYETSTKKKNEYIEKIDKDIFQINQKNIELYNENERLTRNYQKNLTDYEKTLQGKDGYISELEEQRGLFEAQCGFLFKKIKQINKDYENNLSAYEETIQGKDEYISNLERQQDVLEEQCRDLFENIEQINKDYESNLSAYEETVHRKNNYISELEAERIKLEKRCRDLFENIEQINKDYESNLSAYEETMQGKDCYISKLEKHEKELKANCKQLFDDIKRINQEYRDNISKYQDTVEGKDTYISELEKNIGILNAFINSKEIYIEQLQCENIMNKNELEKQCKKVEVIKEEMKKLLFGKKTLERLEKSYE